MLTAWGVRIDEDGKRMELKSEAPLGNILYSDKKKKVILVDKWKNVYYNTRGMHLKICGINNEQKRK